LSDELYFGLTETEFQNLESFLDDTILECHNGLELQRVLMNRIQDLSPNKIFVIGSIYGSMITEMLYRQENKKIIPEAL